MSSNNTASTDSTPLILIYYNIRGKLQPIRNLIAYLQLPHIELHIEEKSQEKKVLAEQIRTLLKDIPIESSQLPLLLHEGFRIYDSYPIMAYICRRFGHEELLGRTIQQRVSPSLARRNWSKSWASTSPSSPQPLLNSLSSRISAMASQIRKFSKLNAPTSKDSWNSQAMPFKIAGIWASRPTQLSFWEISLWLTLRSLRLATTSLVFSETSIRFFSDTCNWE